MNKIYPLITATLLSASLAATGIANAHSSEIQGFAAQNPAKTTAAMPMHATASANNDMNPRGAMSHQNMSHQFMNHQMMDRSMGHGMMAGNYHHSQAAIIDRKLTVEDVKKIIDGHLVWMGHKRLKVGEVIKQDDGLLIADINTTDGSLAMRMEVIAKSGAMHLVIE